jgi:hypothetical protein
MLVLNLLPVGETQPETQFYVLGFYRKCLAEYVISMNKVSHAPILGKETWYLTIFSLDVNYVEPAFSLPMLGVGLSFPISSRR